MTRLPRSALAVLALSLAACNGGTSSPPAADPGMDPAQTSSSALLQDPGESTQDPAPDTAGSSVTETPAPESDDAGATSAADLGESAERTAGQAVADRTEQFVVAVVTADPAFCQLVVGLTGNAPMADSPDQLRLCEEELIPQLQADVEEQDEGVIEAIQIEGARIEGDTARVTSDNFGAVVAEGFGAADIVLQRFDGQWYVDLGQSDFGD